MFLYENSKSYSPVCEVYYGKPTEFNKIEELLVPVIQACHDATSVSIKKFKSINPNNMKEVREIENILSKFFKIGDIQLIFYMGETFSNTKKNISDFKSDLKSLKDNVIISDETDLEYVNEANQFLNPFNAFTSLPIFNFNSKNKKNPKMAERNNSEVIVNVAMTLVTLSDFTPSELLGIILHEIGHSIDTFILTGIFAIFKSILLIKDANPLSNINEVIPQALISTLLSQTKVIPRNIARIEQIFTTLATKNKFFNKIVNILNDINMRIAPVLKIRDLEYLIKHFLSFNKYNALKAIPAAGLFTNEQFADSLASTYGYGKDLSSALYKMNNVVTMSSTNDINNIFEGGTRAILNLSNTILEILTLPFDEHPGTATRIASQLNKLRKDAKDPNLSPKLKKELNEQISELEEFVDKITNPETIKETGAIASIAINYIVIKIFKGKIDPRTFITQLLKREL